MSSSLIFRPHGDEIQKIYGKYLSKSAMQGLIEVGKKFEVLCDDGLNYIVDVKAFNKSEFYGTLHFCNWSTKCDYTGDFSGIYMAKEGQFTKGLISAKNTYRYSAEDNVVIPSSIGSVGSNSSGGSTDGSNSGQKSKTKSSDFASNTKYPDDFLAKPRYAGSSSTKRQRRGADDTALLVPATAAAATTATGEGDGSIAGATTNEGCAHVVVDSQSSETNITPLPAAVRPGSSSSSSSSSSAGSSHSTGSSLPLHSLLPVVDDPASFSYSAILMRAAAANGTKRPFNETSVEKVVDLTSTTSTSAPVLIVASGAAVAESSENSNNKNNQSSNSNNSSSKGNSDITSTPVYANATNTNNTAATATAAAAAAPNTYINSTVLPNTISSGSSGGSSSSSSSVAGSRTTIFKAMKSEKEQLIDTLAMQRNINESETALALLKSFPDMFSAAATTATAADAVNSNTAAITTAKVVNLEHISKLIQARREIDEVLKLMLL